MNIHWYLAGPILTPTCIQPNVGTESRFSAYDRKPWKSRVPYHREKTYTNTDCTFIDWVASCLFLV